MTEPSPFHHTISPPVVPPRHCASSACHSLHDRNYRNDGGTRARVRKPGAKKPAASRVVARESSQLQHVGVLG